MRHLATLLTLFLLSAQLWANAIGIVVRSGGEVVGILDNQQRPLSRRDSLFEGDTIQTGADGYATLKFADQAVVELGADSQLRVQAYRDKTEDKPKQVLLELLNGKLRTITGVLSNERDAFNLRTPTASIGVRGTEFEVVVLSINETQVKRHAGTVLVRNAQNSSIELVLDASNDTASIRAGVAPNYIDQLSTEPMGPFDSTILEMIGGMPVAPLPVVPPPLPLVVPLSGSGSVSQPLIGGLSSEPVDALVTLVDAQQWPEARGLADELKDAYEGTPRFDLYHGILLMAEGSFDEAIFSFERVLVFEPKQHRARLELGQAYYLTGNYARARDALLQVLLADPPNAVQRKINALLNRIDAAERRSSSQWLVGATAFVGWDSNTNGGSNMTGELDPNLLALTELAAQSRPVASGYSQWSVNSTLLQPTSRYSSNQLTTDVTYKNYFDDQVVDALAVSLQTTFSSQNDRTKASAPIQLQWNLLDNQSWGLGVSASATQQWRVWGPLYAGVKFGSQVSIALHDDNITSVKDLAGIAFDARERGRSHAFSTLYLQTQQAGQDDGHSEWRGLANRYQLIWDLPLELQGIATVEHQWRQYNEDDPFFTLNKVTTQRKRRQDQMLSVQFNGIWAPESWIKTQTHASWEWLNSNINAYGRERFVISQAVSVQF